MQAVRHIRAYNTCKIGKTTWKPDFTFVSSIIILFSFKALTLILKRILLKAVLTHTNTQGTFIYQGQFCCAGWMNFDIDRADTCFQSGGGTRRISITIQRVFLARALISCNYCTQIFLMNSWRLLLFHTCNKKKLFSYFSRWHQILQQYTLLILLFRIDKCGLRSVILLLHSSANAAVF